MAGIGSETVAIGRRLFAGPLWRHPDFLHLWLGQTVSRFGSEVSDLAVPTAAIFFLHTGPVQLGILGALRFAPFLVLGLPVGVLVDRIPRRGVMIAADVGRCLLLASIPIGFLRGALTLVQLYAVTLGTAVCSVFFDVAYQAWLPTLVDRQHLVEGNAKLAVSDSVAGSLGPALAGALIQVLGAARAVAIDSASFLASAISLLAIRRAEGRSAERALAESSDARWRKACGTCSGTRSCAASWPPPPPITSAP